MKQEIKSKEKFVGKYLGKYQTLQTLQTLQNGAATNQIFRRNFRNSNFFGMHVNLCVLTFQKN